MIVNNRRSVFIGGLVAVVLAAVGWASVAGWAHVGRQAVAAGRLAYWIEGNDPALKQQVEVAIRAGSFVPAAVPQAQADIVFTIAGAAGSAGVLPAPAGNPAKLGTPALLVSSTTPSLYASLNSQSSVDVGRRTAVIQSLAKTPAQAAPKWTMTAVGDIGLGRSVYNQMATSGDYNRPFSYFSDTLRSADLAIANLECALSDQHAVISDGGMTFVAPFAAAAGLKSSGLDAVSVANNHSFNGGAAGYRDTLSELDRLGIAAFGGALTSAAARSPRILTVKGIKVALLGYSSIVGSTPAGPDTPGMAYLDMAPWGKYDPAQADQMAADIKAAKAQADIVLVYYHWGTEYTHDANADQREAAHRAIDAGADLVIGAHPHWTQGIEWYQGHMIAYSLGNFIFDQDWAPETKQGTMLQTTFVGKRLVEARLVPYEIFGNMQPRPASTPAAAQILAGVYAHSWWAP